MGISVGEQLREARQTMGASLYNASRGTNVRVDFLQHMERDNFRFMTGSVHIRGLLKTYARWLNLDEEQVATAFDTGYGLTDAPSVEEMAKPPAQKPARRRPKWFIAAGVASLLLIGMSMVGLMQPTGPADVADPPAAPDTLAGRPPQPRPLRIAEVAPKPAPVTLEVTVTGARSWISVSSVGKGSPSYEGMLLRGESRRFMASKALEVIIGDLGAVRIRVNGRTLSPRGAPGSAGSFTFRPSTAQIPAR